MTTMADNVARTSNPVLRKILIRAISFVMPLATLVLMAFFAVNTTAFLTFDNFVAIVSQNAAVIIITAASAMLLMAGYVDLSVGSLMGLAGVVAGLAFLKAGVAAGIFSALAVGFGWGLMNGVLPYAPLNRRSMLHDYIRPEQRIVACPNQDVAYGGCVAAFDISPVVIQVPTSAVRARDIIG